ncbi:MAG: SGNH/GDSL hydrolase family protein [Rhodobacteraceae bacterium]|nr:MAG: SGNH/GDSL hydrolase family protein [Paracoccaceae bacterium]
MRLNRVTGPFDAVLVALGVNDVTRFVPRPVWLGRQRTLIDRLTRDFAARHVLLTGLPPMDRFPLLPQPLRWTLGRHAARLDEGLRTLAAGHPACEVLSFDLPDDPALMAEDGFHPSPATYAIWADMAAGRILARL